jgi:type I restriction enzyme R subunit
MQHWRPDENEQDARGGEEACCRPDYALFLVGQWRGVIEAKKVTVNPQNVLEQAKRCALWAADGTGNWDGYLEPFLYLSNGALSWHIDIGGHKHISRTATDYHMPTTSALDLFAHDLSPS